MQVRQNAQFFSVAIYVEQPNGDWLSRLGLDPAGALYKALGDPIGTYAKKTRLNEDNSDLAALLAGLNLAGANRENFIFDHLNLADAVNYMATVAICQNIDASDKNHFLYRDTNGTREWSIFPWDLDLTFGPDYLNTDTIVYNLCDTNAPHCPSHPFIGARPYVLSGGKYHPLLEAIVAAPRARQMLLRRLRALTDQFLGANYFQHRIEQLFPLLAADAQMDLALWGANAHFPGQTYTLRQALDRIENEYLAPRLEFLTSANIVGIGSALPASQPTNAVIGIAEVDSNPDSGNVNEQYICLTNANLFPVDISGWSLVGAVRHAFAAGTVVPAGGALYASPNVAAFRARVRAPHGGMGLFAQGNYQGVLNAWGGSLALTDAAGGVVSEKNYVGNPSGGLVTTPAAIAYTHAGAVYAQDFDSLPNPGGSTVQSANPVTINQVTYALANPFGLAFPALSPGGLGLSNTMCGWFGLGSIAVKFGASEGDQSTGGLISFGSTNNAASSANRALGLLATSSTGPTAFGVCLINGAGLTLNQINLQFTGELWRQSDAPKRLLFGYYIDPAATNGFSTNVATFLPSLDVSFPALAGATTAFPVDGAAAANQAVLGVTGQPIADWPPGAALWLVWQMADAAGKGQGLAIDNLSFSASVARPVLSIRGAGATVILTWPYGYLQSSAAASGPYFTLSGAVSPLTNAPSGRQQYFRVVMP